MIQILLLSLILTLGQPSQKLTFDGQLLTLQFNVSHTYLPLPLQPFLHQNPQFTSIKIQYGSKHHHQLHGVPPNGIRVWIKDAQSFSQRTRQMLLATFSISVQMKYSYFFFNKELLISDPNDKFCGHHVEEILRNFLPCQSHSGLSQLVKSQAFLQGNYVGMEVQWDKDAFHTKIHIEIKDKNPVNVKRIKILERCQHFNEIHMSDGNGNEISLNEVVLSRIQQTIKNNSNGEENIKVRKRVIGEWYQHQKTIFVELIGRVEKKTQVRIPEILPLGVQVTNKKVYCMEDNQTVPIIHQILMRDHYGGSHQFQTQFHMEPFHTRCSIQINMVIHPINFDKYESIYGGGQEIPVLPILFYERDEGKLNKVYPPPIVIKIPEPDFSIPFHVMTFTMAGVGYLWLTVWRTFFKYNL